MKTGLWRIGKGSYGQMRLKLTGLGQMGGSTHGKKKREPLSDRTTTPTVKHGGGNNLLYGVVCG